MDPHELALEVAARVHAVVAPHLATPDNPSPPEPSAPIEDLAAGAVRELPRGARRHRVHRRRRRAGALRRAARDPHHRSGGRPPADRGRDRHRLRLDRGAPPDEAPTLSQVSFAVVLELATGQRYCAERGGGARAEEADGSAIPVAPTADVDLDALFWTAGAARPPVTADDRRARGARRPLGQRGGYYDLGSVAFNCTRIITGALGAYVDIGMRLLDELPETEPAFLAAGGGAVCATFPNDVAAAALIVQEAGGVITGADGRSIADHPAIGSSRGDGLAIVAAASSALHAEVIEAIDRGMTHLGSWFSAQRGH